MTSTTYLKPLAERDVARGRLHKACMARLLPQPFNTPRPIPLDTLHVAIHDHPLFGFFLQQYTWQDIRTRLGLA